MNRQTMSRVVVIAALTGAALTGCSGEGAGSDDSAAVGPPPAPPPLTLVQRPDATGGEALYIVKCAPCHAEQGMGTGLLQRAGREQPMLELRSDLTADFVVAAARNGIGNMPAIPRGEVPDADLQAIGEYLAAGPHEVAQ